MKSVSCGAIALALVAAACSKTEPVAQNNDVAVSVDETNAAAAAAGIDGTWKVDMATAKFEDKKPYTFAIKDGTYKCDSCLPPFSVAADGQWHKVARPVADELSVTVVDDKHVKLASRKGGKDLSSSSFTLSDDGKSMTNEVYEPEFNGSQPVKRTGHFTRSGDAPAGSHPLSGAWSIAQVTDVSDPGRTFTITTTADSFGTSGNGESYVAKLGGEAVAIKNNPGNVMAKVVKDGDTYVETLTRKGETIEVNRFTLGADGVLHLESVDPRTGNTSKVDANRG